MYKIYSRENSISHGGIIVTLDSFLEVTIIPFIALPVCK